MMKRILNFYLSTGLLMLLPFFSFSQWLNQGIVSVSVDFPDVALIDIEPDGDNNIQFALSSATESGEKPELITTSVNESLWVNYSSAFSSSFWVNSRAITAQISDGFLPDGMQLFLEASNYTGIGKGDKGTPTGKIELANYPKVIINGIGNCFTGDGINSGHKLEFSINLADNTEITSAGQYNLVILYTLTDN